MSFEIRSEGEAIHTLDAPVNRIGIATEKGVVTWINSQDIGYVDLVVEYVNPGVVRLDQLEAAQAQERAKIAQTVDVQGGNSIPSPDKDLTEDTSNQQANDEQKEEQARKNTEAIENFQSEANTENVPEADPNGIVDYKEMYEEDTAENGKSKLNQALEDVAVAKGLNPDGSEKSDDSDNSDTTDDFSFTPAEDPKEEEGQ